MMTKETETELEQETLPVEARDAALTGADSGAIMNLIARAASDETVDIEKMERLFAMRERMIAAEAERGFHEAFAAMQEELPEVTKRGETRDKDGNLMYNYAKWEDINRLIKPILAKYGFALTFRIDPHDNGLLITAKLSRSGHTEQTSIVQSLDMGGAKMNANQARGSATSYGKRYTAGALLNLVSHEEEDTDGVMPLSGDVLTPDQVKTIRELLKKMDRKEEAFLSYMGRNGVTVASELESVPVESFEKMQQVLAQWAQKMGAQ